MDGVWNILSDIGSEDNKTNLDRIYGREVISVLNAICEQRLQNVDNESASYESGLLSFPFSAPEYHFYSILVSCTWVALEFF